jgi:hypothetical protein
MGIANMSARRRSRFAWYGPSLVLGCCWVSGELIWMRSPDAHHQAALSLLGVLTMLSVAGPNLLLGKQTPRRMSDGPLDSIRLQRWSGALCLVAAFFGIWAAGQYLNWW